MADMPSFKKLSPSTHDLDLNEDVLAEILRRLPIKQLVQVMCVSKSWCRIISSIVQSRRRKTIRPISGFFLQWNDNLGVLNSCRLLRNEVFGYMRSGDGGAQSGEAGNAVSDTSMSFLPCHPDFKILDCRDGLLLCSPKSKMRDGETYYLCNPLTRRWILLPKTPVSGSCATAALAFESPVSLHYKVFRFFGRSYKRGFRSMIYAEVFSSRTGEWAKREMELDPSVRRLCDQRAVFLEGALYLQTYKHVAVRVEVMEERCSVLALPTYKPEGNKCSMQVRMGVCQGRVHYACRDGAWLRIWVVGGGGAGDGWVLKRSIRIHDIQHALVSNVTVLGFHPEKDVIYVRVHSSVESIQFNEDGTRSYDCYLYDIRPQRNCNADDLWFWVYPFSESLHPVSVDMLSHESPVS